MLAPNSFAARFAIRELPGRMVTHANPQTPSPTNHDRVTGDASFRGLACSLTIMGVGVAPVAAA